MKTSWKAVAQCAQLAAAWQRRSLASVWTGAPEEWWTVTVDLVSNIMSTGGGSVRQAFWSLGADRANAGIGLREARADALIVTDLAGSDPVVTAEVVDATTLGWIDSTLEQIIAAPCVDPLTELAPASFLATRLDEAHAEAALRGRDAADCLALVIVRTQPAAHPIERETHMITIQVAMRHAFRGGETLARIGHSSAAALVSREPVRLRRSLEILNEALDAAMQERRLPKTRVWLENLPADHSCLSQVLREATA